MVRPCIDAVPWGRQQRFKAGPAKGSRTRVELNVDMQAVKLIHAFKEAAKTGGLFFLLIVWMSWLFLSRQKWLV
jgi:hypothetical protein